MGVMIHEWSTTRTVTLAVLRQPIRWAGRGLEPVKIELTLDMDIVGEYAPGRPACTPRGEYAPVDPPEPPTYECQITHEGNDMRPFLDPAAIDAIEREVLAKCEEER